MTKTILIAAALVLACSAGETTDPAVADLPGCPGATTVELTPADAQVPNHVTCTWQCTEKDGIFVVLAWEAYDLTADGMAYALTDTQTFVGACVAAEVIKAREERVY